MNDHKRIDDRHIATRIEEVLAKGADVIVLGCTHYHWIEQEIKRLSVGRAQVIQPEEAIVRRVKHLLGRL